MVEKSSEKPTIFVRTASGLVRVFGAWDMFMYSVLAMVVMTTGIWVYIWAPFAWPGADVPLGIVVTTIWGIFMILVYAMLTSSMPRSGGEYVWQSRLIHPALAFAAGPTLPFAIVGFYWAAEGAIVACQMGISPTLIYLGNLLNNPGLISLGQWFFGIDGFRLVATIFNVTVFLLFLPGLRLYLKLQHILFWGLIASWVTILVILLTSSNTAFVGAFNNFIVRFNPEMTNAYQQVIDIANTAGFNPNPPFSWYGTLGVIPLAWWSLSYPMLITLNAGEIKGADSLKRMTTVMLACLFFCGIYMTLVGWATLNVAGYQFQNAVSAAFFTGKFALPSVFPFYTAFAAMLVNNPILIILIFIGIIFNGYQLTCNCYVCGTRVFVSESFDRILPEWVSGISKRFPGSPVNSMLLFLVGTEIVIFLWEYLSPYILYSMYVCVASYLLTMIAGLVFPFRKSAKDIWRASPAAKWRFAISISAAIAIPFLLLQLYYYTVTPELGLSAIPTQIAIFGIVILLIIYYYVRRYYLGRKGIDLDLAFKVVPPA